MEPPHSPASASSNRTILFGTLDSHAPLQDDEVLHAIVGACKALCDAAEAMVALVQGATTSESDANAISRSSSWLTDVVSDCEATNVNTEGKVHCLGNGSAAVVVCLYRIRVIGSATSLSSDKVVTATRALHAAFNAISQVNIALAPAASPVDIYEAISSQHHSNNDSANALQMMETPRYKRARKGLQWLEELVTYVNSWTGGSIRASSRYRYRASLLALMKKEVGAMRSAGYVRVYGFGLGGGEVPHDKGNWVYYSVAQWRALKVVPTDPPHVIELMYPESQGRSQELEQFVAECNAVDITVRHRPIHRPPPVRAHESDTAGGGEEAAAATGPARATENSGDRERARRHDDRSSSRTWRNMTWNGRERTRTRRHHR